MNNMDHVYRELHQLVRHGQKQGFVAGIIFSGAIHLMSQTRYARRSRPRPRVVRPES